MVTSIFPAYSKTDSGFYPIGMAKMKLINHSMRLLLLGAFSILFVGQVSPSLAQRAVTVDQQAPRHAGEFVVPINKSQVLRLNIPYEDIAIGNPKIADVLPLTDRQIYVLGKSVGSTNLLVYGENKILLAVIDLVISYDVFGLKKRMFDIMPKEKIEIRAVGNSIVLSGIASSAAALTRAIAIARAFAPANRVTNLLRVEGSQQVLLAVKFAEVQRTAAKDLGITTTVAGQRIGNEIKFTLGTGSAAGNFATSIANSAAVGTFNFAVGSLAVAMDFLETKGLSKTLAEPNLMALSGDTAEFLAGGEFPIQNTVVSSGGGSTEETEFKQFGISLSFTPTVLESGLINLIVRPEVSSIDTTLGTSTIPGLKTRRASTTIELRDGQSFAIAGLLQNDFGSSVSQYPWLGDIPILGALFRSSGFNRLETELVILVTVYLVKSSPAGTLSTPVDNFLPPGDLGFFVFGQMEAPGSRLPRGGGAIGKAAGGISGNYGHIIK